MASDLEVAEMVEAALAPPIHYLTRDGSPLAYLACSKRAWRRDEDPMWRPRGTYNPLNVTYRACQQDLYWIKGAAERRSVFED